MNNTYISIFYFLGFNLRSLKFVEFEKKSYFCAYFQEHGEPLFSSHMLDLSEEFDEENIATCVKYFKRMAPMKIWLEMEIGITGGEEDGVDNTGVKAESLYTKPEQVWNVHKSLSEIGPMFSIAAAFGNVHGVYKAGNVVLSPQLLVSVNCTVQGLHTRL